MAPTTVVYLPSEQSEQTAVLAMLAYVPCGHASHGGHPPNPYLEAVPGGHESPRSPLPRNKSYLSNVLNKSICNQGFKNKEFTLKCISVSDLKFQVSKYRPLIALIEIQYYFLQCFTVLILYDDLRGKVAPKIRTQSEQLEVVKVN